MSHDDESGNLDPKVLSVGEKDTTQKQSESTKFELADNLCKKFLSAEEMQKQ
jgi:hypothetical protein